LSREALRLFTLLLGSEHQYTIVSMNNLAELLNKTGCLTEALLAGR
jgi:hypothetical protein